MRRFLTNIPSALALGTLGSLATAQSPCSTNYYRLEEGAANAPAAGVGVLLDSLGGPAGTPSGDPIYRADVMSPSIPSSGDPNALSLQFNGAQSALFSSMFIFHRQYADATLEFLIKVPDQGHRAIFWTRAGDTDANRFNIVVNSGGGFGFDYRAPDGTLHIPSASGSVFFFSPNAWHHIAVVRAGNTYSFYLDGVFQALRTDPVPDLPTSAQWSIAGRTALRFSGLIDEIRFSPCALTPDQFLISACYSNCDGSTLAPLLTVNDFICFMNRYAANDPYANCDGSTVPPALNVADFICFANRFAAGCP